MNQPQVLQRWALADGDGEQAKPFKSEWATVKDGLLYIGSIGKEWTIVADNKSHVLHRNSEWVDGCFYQERNQKPCTTLQQMNTKEPIC